MAAKKRAEKRRSSLSRKTIAKRAKSNKVAASIQDGSVGGASSSTSSSNNQPQQAENVAITTTTPQNYTPTKLRKVVNKSYEKIINNSYISSKVRNTRMTRSLSKKLSFLYKKKQDTLNATGYKLQEVTLLKQSIN